MAYLLLAAAAHASTITVTSTADDYDRGPNGNCTLREAVIAANTNTKTDKCTAGGGADTIVIPAGTYTLTIPGTGEDAAHTGDLDLTAGVTITGAGVGATVIDVGGLDNGIEVRVKSGTSFVSKLTIRHAGGAGIANLGSKLVLTDVGIEDATWSQPPTDSPAGGGLYQTSGKLTAHGLSVVGTQLGSGLLVTGGDVEVDSSAFNGSVNVWEGGGIAVRGGTVSVSSSVIGDEMVEPAVDFDCSNRGESGGGGVFIATGSLVVSDSVVAGNCVGESVRYGNGGGGVFVAGGSLELVRTRVLRNVAWGTDFESVDGGGILAMRGALRVVDSRVFENVSMQPFGGGVGGVAVDLPASVELMASSVDANVGRAVTVVGGGGRGHVAIRGCTIAGDPGEISPAPTYAGGGVDAFGDVEILESTIEGGSNPEFAVAALTSGVGTLTVGASIVRGPCAVENGGAIDSQGYNLAFDPSCAFGQPTDLVGVDPLLAPLGFYGGPTPTMPPLPGSPAIDSGDPDGCSATDQRGFARPVDGDRDGTARCDRGAVEVACSGLDGQGDECVPLACGSVPHSSGQLTTTLLPLVVAGAAVRWVRARRGRAGST